MGLPDKCEALLLCVRISMLQLSITHRQIEDTPKWLTHGLLAGSYSCQPSNFPIVPPQLMDPILSRSLLPTVKVNLPEVTLSGPQPLPPMPSVTITAPGRGVPLTCNCAPALHGAHARHPSEAVWCVCMRLL